MDYTDLHIHLLPGMDDGPADMEESLALLRQAFEAGTRRFCATPHFGPPHGFWERRRARRLVEDLEARAAEAGWPAEIRLGAEVSLFPEIVEEARKGTLPALGSGKYLLLETPAGVLPPHFPEFLFRFRSTGLVPVLAHPERTEVFWRHPERMRDLVGAGALIQVTAGSLVGEGGRKVRRTARRFLEAGWVHALASDGHGVPARLLDLSEAEREAAGLLKDPARARQLVTEGPWRLMGGDRSPRKEGDEDASPPEGRDAS